MEEGDMKCMHANARETRMKRTVGEAFMLFLRSQHDVAALQNACTPMYTCSMENK